MSKLVAFISSVVKPLTLTLVFVIIRVITGRPTNFIEASLHHAFREIVLHLLESLDYFETNPTRRAT